MARLWLYRTLAVVGIPALLLLGLEGVLRLAGFGRSASFLIPDDQPGCYRTNPDFVSLFMPGSFDLRPLNIRVAVRKPANSIRIVVLGESAAQGIPAPAFGFPPQLRAQLRARYPGKQIEVINTGIVAINSHVVYQIARDLADFSPDLFVVYVGNNEVVGPYGPGCTYLSAMPPLPVIRLSVFVRSTRTGQLLGMLIGKFARSGPPPPEWGGMSMFVDSAVAGDDPRLEAVYRNLGANLSDIVRVATSAGAKTLLCTVVANLKDCPPLLSRHRTGLSTDELATWQVAFNRGRLAWLLGETAAARQDLAAARRLDPQYAETLFMLGSLETQAGNPAAARPLLLEALHWDALRFRPDARINDAIRRVARAHPEARLLDAAMLLGSDAASPATPTGRELMFEHVHFDWDGNFQLARALAQEAETTLFGVAPGAPPWLDSASCAAAVGHTRQARADILKKIATIIQNPPFTNQLTYPEDMARFTRELAQAEADQAKPEVIRLARETVAEATKHDPDNPDLAKMAEDIANEEEQTADALIHLQRARRLQPSNFRLAAAEGILLTWLGRFEEAEKILRETTQACPPRELAVVAPAFVDFYTRARRVQDGLRTLDGFIARSPGDRKLRQLRGGLADFAGDKAAAEREYRALLAEDPGDPKAQEALVAFLQKQGRVAEANQASLAAVGHQAGNQPNNLRAAAVAEAGRDDAKAVEFLVAAERSGPIPAAVELRIARKLYGLGQTEEALTHLGWARRISRYEGNPAVTEAITEFIARLRPENP
ncbi:MAG: hypothetical protein PSU94_13235 [Lacunisphaera sp.]|nr:hypothetical protein [Lacunisphaera sp.]